MGNDLPIVLQWWITLLVVGVVGYPWARKIFGAWYDQGYFATKAIGLAMITYVVWILATVKILAFSWIGIVMAGVLVIGVGWWMVKRDKGGKRVKWGVIIVQEIIFLLCLLLWVAVKAHEPSIHGLEKFMDFGFTKSILTSKFFPPEDMWYQGGNINYYYFGHMSLAVLTKLSGIDLGYTFNLILTTLFAWTATMSAGIAYQCLGKLPKKWAVGGAILAGFLVSLGGNLHTIYAFTVGYDGEKPVGFWTIFTDPKGTKVSLEERFGRYWYPNATRFIPLTIHEFPAYSFAVSDIHGHVLSLPYVLLAMAMLVEMFGFGRVNWKRYIAYGGLVAVLFMTNASDGPIYMGLFMILLASRSPGWRVWEIKWLLERAKIGVLVVGIFVLGIVPFMLHFNSFVSGLGVNCPPKQLAGTDDKPNKYGPFIFESTQKCQKSPLWMMAVLWGFGWYTGGWFLTKRKEWNQEQHLLWWAWGVMFWYCVGLVIFPEFLYFKDIYPAHFRSNTMFKLGYQAFMMWGLLGGITITHLLYHKNKVVILSVLPLVFLVSIYPYFAVRSYFGIGNVKPEGGLFNVNAYQSIYGLDWMKKQYPGDYAAIAWLDTQESYEDKPTIVEAVGDSYTDYGRFSAFTGLPTIVGWPVHEWLWRGSYSVAAPRIEEVRKIYETPEAVDIRPILNKYQVKYIVVGNLERQKYPTLNAEGVAKLGAKVFEDQGTAIYKYE